MGSLNVTQRSGQTFEVLFDDKDEALVRSHSWRVRKRYVAAYAVTDMKDDSHPRGWRQVSMHQLFMPDGMVDHINQNGLDNRRSNLRYATRAQNAANTKERSGESGFKGVSRSSNGKKWIARICIDGRDRHLGTFSSREEAALRYNEAAFDAWGEHAYLNEVDTPSRWGTISSTETWE